jgi:AbrB family looped-hinge helix DNA binding protein
LTFLAANVIYGDMRQKKQRPSRKPGFSEESSAYTPEVNAPAGPPRLVTVELAAGGRVVIPAPMRSALGMKIGDRLTVRLEGNELRIHTYEEGLRQANALVDKYLPEDSVEEFLRRRREEGAREAKKQERWSRDE